MTEREYACPVHEHESKIDGNGQVFYSKCLKCGTDTRGICIGLRVLAIDNFKGNNYYMALKKGSKTVKDLASVKGDTLGSFSEFERKIEDLKRKGLI